MVAAGSRQSSSVESFEIRSGMSVQDLKQLTAQRAQRQRMEFWESQARNSPRTMAMSEWNGASVKALNSPSNSSTGTQSCNSSTSGSNNSSPVKQGHYYAQQQYASMHTSAAYGSSGSVSAHSHYALSSRGARGEWYPPSSSDRMFVTCGGQVVSLMEGVVNAPRMALGSSDLFRTL